jgi:hypothetical protein
MHSTSLCECGRMLKMNLQSEVLCSKDLKFKALECMICRVVVWGCSFQDSCVFGMALYVCLMHVSNCVIYLSHVNRYVLCLKLCL